MCVVAFDKKTKNALPHCMNPYSYNQTTRSIDQTAANKLWYGTILQPRCTIVRPLTLHPSRQNLAVSLAVAEHAGPPCVQFSGLWLTHTNHYTNEMGEKRCVSKVRRQTKESQKRQDWQGTIHHNLSSLLTIVFVVSSLSSPLSSLFESF